MDPLKDYDLAFENLALRQQLAILNRPKKRPQIRTKDRLFCIILSRFWSNWRQALIVVKPETVVRWHKNGFQPDAFPPYHATIPDMVDFLKESHEEHDFNRFFHGSDRHSHKCCGFNFYERQACSCQSITS